MRARQADEGRKRARPPGGGGEGGPPLKLRQTSTAHSLQLLLGEVDQLLAVTLEAEVGAVAVEELGPEQLDELSWARARQSLYQQSLAVPDPLPPTHSTAQQVSQVEMDLSYARSTLYRAHSQASSSQTLVDRLAETPVMEQVVVFPSAEQLYLKEMIHHRDEQSSRALRLHQQLQSLRVSNRELRQQISKLRLNNRTVFQSLHFSGDPRRTRELEGRTRGDPESLEAEEYLQDLRSQNAVLRSVLPLLVVESGVDWAASPDLLKLVLTCGGDGE
eukprot:TRINITY_DN12600_c0_g1_i1.p1 TRINITY_DN12600_c0_g1~~TRINITY_DN12600_c0_g1_i1.p1  ORF type:complete len:305 (-),score=48.44 TRINITY_DN12600_c0_g1_i1:28-852(-)